MLIKLHSINTKRINQLSWPDPLCKWKSGVYDKWTSRAGQSKQIILAFSRFIVILLRLA